METSSIIITILLIFLSVAVFYLVRFSLLILKIEDAVEESLDVLDERYRSISEILEIPLFYDSPQIRQVLEDIKGSRRAVLKIAQSFASIDNQAVEKEENEEQL